jgi:multicomponent Na+:H+ antiporter subunit D
MHAKLRAARAEAQPFKVPPCDSGRRALYVALELLTFAAVPLVSLDGRAETLQAALRYLLFALFGSILYLVGTALLYGTYGTLDVTLLAARVSAAPTTIVAAALMTAGLFAKTALFPLHLWLPPAHAGAPAAGSAVLSALVVKGSFFIAVRLWFDVMPALPGFAAVQLPAVLGGAAILFGSVVALRQERLKLLVAYSTLAQIGYLFLMFPLAFDPAVARLQHGGALAGGIIQAASHATAKAAMFMVAGLIYEVLGHDRIGRLAGLWRALPIGVLAFALAGVALIGLPPSGAYLAKTLLVAASSETSQWWWGAVVQAGGVLTSSYVLLVVMYAGLPAAEPIALRSPVSRLREAAALVLAVCSLLLGLLPWHDVVPVPTTLLSIAPTLETFVSALWPVLVGGALALLFARSEVRLARVPRTAFTVVAGARRAAVPFVDAAMRVDNTLRQWPAAGLALLLVAISLGAAIMAGR